MVLDVKVNKLANYGISWLGALMVVDSSVIGVMTGSRIVVDVGDWVERVRKGIKVLGKVIDGCFGKCQLG